MVPIVQGHRRTALGSLVLPVCSLRVLPPACGRGGRSASRLNILHLVRLSTRRPRATPRQQTNKHRPRPCAGHTCDMLLTPVISPVASSPISNSPTFHTLPSASTPRAGGPFAELEPLAVDGTISTLGTQQKTKGLSDKSIPIQSQASTKRQSHQATADSCGGAALGEEAEPSEYSAGLEESACTKSELL